MMMNRYYAGYNPYYKIPPIQFGGALGDIPEATLFRGLRRQRGGGLASILSMLLRKFGPVAQSFAKNVVAPHAKTAAKGVLTDFIDGENIGRSLKRRGKTALKDMARSAVGTSQTGSGRRRRNISVRKRRKRVVRRKKGRKVTKRRIRRKKRVLNPKDSVFDI